MSQNEQIKKMKPDEAQAVESVGAVTGSRQEPVVGRMKIDLHCHTEASFDCATPLPDIAARCRKAGITVQAITDHNEVWGAQQVKMWVDEQRADGDSSLTIIVGEEVLTNEGEIIGLFLKEKIEPGLSPEECIRQIRAQGGLTLLPHGFDSFKPSRLKPEARERIADQLDIIETFNARISRPRYNRAAVEWCKSRKILMSAGSDSHRLSDIGDAWVEAPYQRISTPQDLLAALQNGVPIGTWDNPIFSLVAKWFDRFR